MSDDNHTRRRFMRTAGVAVGSAALIGTASASHEETWTFHAELTGEGGVETPARGHATFEIPPDSHEIQYTIDVTYLCYATQAHIHLGEAGEDGPVVSWLYPEDGAEPELVEGRFDGTLAEGTVSLDGLVGPLEGADANEVVTALMEEDAYVNVHTEDNPAGEIRGQIRSDAGTEAAIREAMDAGEGPMVMETDDSDSDNDSDDANESDADDTDDTDTDDVSDADDSEDVSDDSDDDVDSDADDDTDDTDDSSTDDSDDTDDSDADDSEDSTGDGDSDDSSEDVDSDEDDDEVDTEVQAAGDAPLALGDLYIGSNTTGDEYIELVNVGSEPIDFSEWTLEDRIGGGVIQEDDDPWAFPDGLVLGPDETVTIYTNQGETSVDDLEWYLGESGGTDIWRQDADDVVVVRNAEGAVVFQGEYETSDVIDANASNSIRGLFGSIRALFV